VKKKRKGGYLVYRRGAAGPGGQHEVGGVDGRGGGECWL